MHMLQGLTGTQRTQLLSDSIHALVVVVVVLATTFLAAAAAQIPQDVLGAVYGGAIGYAAGRAGNVRADSPTVPGELPGGRRATDPPANA